GSWNLAAQTRGGEDLARIADAGRVERAPHELHGIQIDLAEHLRHIGLLVSTDAMLTGDGAAGVNAIFKNLGCDRLRVRGLARNRLVIADERVKVSVARMKNVPDSKPRPCFERAYPPEHLRQLRARNDPVLNVVTRGDPPHRRKRRFAPLPNAFARGVVSCDVDRDGA